MEKGPNNRRKFAGTFGAKTSAVLAVCLAAWTTMALSWASLFQVRFIEAPNGSRLIATSNYNYAITTTQTEMGPKSSWLAISVNGDRVIMLTSEGQKTVATRDELGRDRMAQIEQMRDSIANGNLGQQFIYSDQFSGPSSVQMGPNGGGYSMSSSSSSSSFMSSQQIGQQQQQFGNSRANRISFSAKDENNFSISKSGLPFNWWRVFFNNNFLTFVYRNGAVISQSESNLSPQEAAAVNQLRGEVAELRRQQAAHFAAPMPPFPRPIMPNFFGANLGAPLGPSFRPPSPTSMFGDNFPFGPNNSPLTADAGWPFANSAAQFGGANAFAFAGRR